MEYKQKLKQLNSFLCNVDRISIAFSGGVDSNFLLKAAQDILKNKVLAITVKSPFFSNREYNEVVEYFKNLKIKHKIIDIDLTKFNEISDNQPDRCYKCKYKMFEEIKKASLEENILYVADGSNIDDLSDYRPGMKALKELGIISPLVDAGINKEEIRFLSQQMGLKSWNKPAYACLASRFPYGQKITKDKLFMVERAEQYLIDIGFQQIRVRHHGDIARIEVGTEERIMFFKDEVLDKVYNKFKDIGFSYTALDLKGYRTGSLNENIMKIADY